MQMWSASENGNLEIFLACQNMFNYTQRGSAIQRHQKMQKSKTINKEFLLSFGKFQTHIKPSSEQFIV